MWDIRGRQEQVATLVQAGFLVRSAADIGTREARTKDYGRFKMALDAGVQLIATDFYPGNASPIDTDYVIAFDDGGVMRCD